jgi:nicotinamide-nucleotide amidase
MENLISKVVKILKKKKIKIAFAESCTGGLLSSSIIKINGASKVFSLGLITYSNESKIKILKVPIKIIRKYGAVSSQCCESMVDNLSRISRCYLNVSITGIAGPNGGSKKKPVGLVFIGIKKSNKIKVFKLMFNNRGRLYIQKSAVKKSLKIILDSLK